jgi:bifunctional enzyme Fae/Hps
VQIEPKNRYLQLAFNGDNAQVYGLAPYLPTSEKLILEAGTPLIKEEGYGPISVLRQYSGKVVADLKTADGALREVHQAHAAGAFAVTALGSAPSETLNLFVQACEQRDVYSVIDMLGVAEPLKVLLRLKRPPDIVMLHKGRDEESTRGKLIQYKHINKIRSKFNVLIAVGGGIGLPDVRSAVFNGANIVVVNLRAENDPWAGIAPGPQFTKTVEAYLKALG